MPSKPTIQDQTFLFTGTLTEFTRDEAEALVEANGGKVISGVTAKLNYLVVGSDAGSKLDKAKKLGTVKILTEKEFLKMVPNGKALSKAATNKSETSKKFEKPVVSEKLLTKKEVMAVSSGSLEEVPIGNQIWMLKNLDIAFFSNGDPIPVAASAKDWMQAAKKKQPACCYYENKKENGIIYGLLYNWYAVTDSRGLAPKGWKIPSDEEWTEMTRSLGKDPGQKFKSPVGWDLDGNGSKKSVLMAAPSGMRQDDGAFFGSGWSASWWCSGSQWFPGQLWIRSVESEDTDVSRNSVSEEEGYSVRCIKV